MDCSLYAPSVCLAVLIGKRIKCRGSSKFFKTLPIPSRSTLRTPPQLPLSCTKRTSFFSRCLAAFNPLPAVRFVIVAAVCFVSQFTALLLCVPASFLSFSASASFWELAKVTGSSLPPLSPL